jgi:GH24 family phage-related lysozyme (muramidase)
VPKGKATPTTPQGQTPSTAPYIEYKTYSASEQILEFTKSWEQFRAYKYKASTSETKYTIGYGHVIQNHENFSEPMSASMGMTLFRQDCIKFEKKLNEEIVAYKLNMTQNQFDAIFDFLFNYGESSFSKHETFANFVRSNNYTAERAKNMFNTYIGPNAEKGNNARNNDRYEIFINGVYKKHGRYDKIS